MPIEFRCASCAQTLRVPDDVAGKNARCPSCGAIAVVPGGAPEATAPSANPYGEGAYTPGGSAPYGGYNDPSAPESLNPYSAPVTDPKLDVKVAPVFGGQITNQPTGVDPILNYAWQIWKENLGLLVGVTAVVAVINFGISFATSFVQGAMQANEAPQEALQAVGFVGWLVGQAAQIFLGIGQVQLILKLLRRQPAQFGDLFGGGPIFFWAVLFSIMYGAAVGVGLLLLIVPGVILLLMCWPAYYLLVDRKAGLIDSFSIAATVTKQNWGTAFILWLASIGIMIAGVLALCVGVLFAAPLVSTIWGTAYLMMSGQLSPHGLAPAGYGQAGYGQPGYPYPQYPQPMPGQYYPQQPK